MEMVKETIKEMLIDRGYEYIEADEKISGQRNDEKIIVMIINNTKLGINNVKNIEIEMTEQRVTDAIVVYDTTITSFAKNALEAMKQDSMMVELFTVAELSFNVSRHELLPKHSLLSQEEKKSLLNTMTVSEKRLPYIMVTDPISRYYGAKIGDVFKIHRKNLTNVPYFRIVT